MAVSVIRSQYRDIARRGDSPAETVHAGHRSAPFFVGDDERSLPPRMAVTGSHGEYVAPWGGGRGHRGGRFELVHRWPHTGPLVWWWWGGHCTPPVVVVASTILILIPLPTSAHARPWSGSTGLVSVSGLPAIHETVPSFGIRTS